MVRCEAVSSVGQRVACSHSWRPPCVGLFFRRLESRRLGVSRGCNRQVRRLCRPCRASDPVSSRRMATTISRPILTNRRNGFEGKPKRYFTVVSSPSVFFSWARSPPLPIDVPISRKNVYRGCSAARRSHAVCQVPRPRAGPQAPSIRPCRMPHGLAASDRASDRPNDRLSDRPNDRPSDRPNDRLGRRAARLAIARSLS